MHKVTLVTVGKVKSAWIKDGCDVYGDRLGHQCDFSEKILSAGSASEEHERILASMEKTTGVFVALDETGKEKSSVELASWMGKQRDIGTPVTFLIGGAYGLSDAIRQKSSLVLSLSRMTLPHELCKLFFLEQLYRAHTILAGTGYHH